MSKELKLETLQDLLTIDTELLKATDNKSILRRLKQLIKVSDKQENKADELAEDFPYEAVSVVGNKLVTLRFDLESKNARVIDVSSDGRDVKGRNFMAQSNAVTKINVLASKQKEIINE